MKFKKIHVFLWETIVLWFAMLMIVVYYERKKRQSMLGDGTTPPHNE